MSKPQQLTLRPDDVSPGQPPPGSLTKQPSRRLCLKDPFQTQGTAFLTVVELLPLHRPFRIRWLAGSNLPGKLRALVPPVFTVPHPVNAESVSLDTGTATLYPSVHGTLHWPFIPQPKHVLRCSFRLPYTINPLHRRRAQAQVSQDRLLETVQSSNNERHVIRPSHQFPQALLLCFRLRQRQNPSCASAANGQEILIPQHL